MAKTTHSKSDVRSVFTQIRLLQIFTALESAGALPATIPDLHTFAFFSNVMSPLWELEPLEGAVLKLSDGPYYPFLQKELDHLVGIGFLEVNSLQVANPTRGPSQLRPTFTIASQPTRKVVDQVAALPDELETLRFLTELAFSFANIKRDHRVAAAIQDATFSNPAVSEDRIINIGEAHDLNFTDASVRAANRFQKFAPAGVTLNRAEKLSMYMSLITRRAHG